MQRARARLLKGMPQVAPLNFTEEVRAMSLEVIHETMVGLSNQTPGPDGVPYQGYPIFGLAGAEGRPTNGG